MYSKLSMDSIHTKYLKVLHEGQNSPEPLSYAAVILEILNVLRPSSQRDKHYIGVAKQHLQEITRHIKKLNEQIELLNERVKILEEGTIKEE